MPWYFQYNNNGQFRVDSKFELLKLNVLGHIIKERARIPTDHPHPWRRLPRRRWMPTQHFGNSKEMVDRRLKKKRPGRPKELPAIIFRGNTIARVSSPTHHHPPLSTLQDDRTTVLFCRQEAFNLFFKAPTTTLFSSASVSKVLLLLLMKATQERRPTTSNNSQRQRGAVPAPSDYKRKWKKERGSGLVEKYIIHKTFAAIRWIFVVSFPSFKCESITCP